MIDPSGFVPTSDNLSWSDFKKLVLSTENYDANTAWDRIYRYDIDNKTEVAFICGQWTATVQAFPTNVTFSVVFDPRQSWVKVDKQTAALLSHEKLHLKMAEYIGQQAKANLPKLVGKGEATSADKQTSIDKATEKAKADLKSKFVDYEKKWGAIDEAVQKAYDAATKHGSDTTAQADWESKWQNLVDAILKDKGW